MIKVLLADDHELVRTGIEVLLNACEDITVVGIAKSGEETIEKVSALLVDVVLVDIDMLGSGAIEVCSQILQHSTQAKIIVVSANNDSLIPPPLFKLGVLGFISKDSPIEEMIKAIRKVIAGDHYLSVDIVYNLASRKPQDYYDSPFLKLSRREAEVVTLILQGKSIKEMSDLLILSDKTVNTYRYRLYDKLKIKNDVELTRLAYKVGYFETALI